MRHQSFVILTLATVMTTGCQANHLPLSPSGDRTPQRLEQEAMQRSCTAEAGGGQIVPANLRERAASGPVRVIVRLQVSGPANPEDAAYLASIARVQDALLRELAGRNASVTARFQTVPLLGLSASAEALDLLAASAHVACVSEDALSAPMAKPPGA